MPTQYLICEERSQVYPSEAEAMAQGLTRQLAGYLYPLLVQLDRQLDKRLVRTFAQLIAVILTFRDRINGLLLTELAEQMGPASQAPAAVKRISNLLHSPKWSAQLLTEYLWERAEHQMQQWEQQQEDALVIWDSSVLEKPESTHNDDYCAVRSSKAARLTRIKPGYYNPPRGPVFVPGLHWIGVLLVGSRQSQGPPQIAAMRWWTSRGPRASYERDEEGKLLVELVARWGRRVLHVFDRGFAGAFWLKLLVAFQVRFVMRWPTTWYLLTAPGQKRKTWQMGLGKRGWEERSVWDSRRGQWVRSSVLAVPVRHPDLPEVPLWLVICRSQGRAPWYLLTNEPIAQARDVWRIAFAYARRWQIELTWRYDKSEFAFQSPRLWFWSEREKLLLMATLAYDFLLSLMQPWQEPVRIWCLRTYCHRTGAHLRRVRLPLTRLRKALSRLWQEHPPAWHLLGHPAAARDPPLQLALTC